MNECECEVTVVQVYLDQLFLQRQLSVGLECEYSEREIIVKWGRKREKGWKELIEWQLDTGSKWVFWREKSKERGRNKSVKQRHKRQRINESCLWINETPTGRQAGKQGSRESASHSLGDTHTHTHKIRRRKGKRKDKREKRKKDASEQMQLFSILKWTTI